MPLDSLLLVGSLAVKYPCIALGIEQMTQLSSKLSINGVIAHGVIGVRHGVIGVLHGVLGCSGLSNNLYCRPGLR